MKILAVDDDGISLNLLQECLAQGGYEYMTFMSSPIDVIEALSDTAIPYDCILLDVEMPEKDGIQLCAEIRELARYRNTPILMITKRSDHTSVKQAFQNGATDYITKPFEFFEVLTRVKVAERLIQERQAAIDSYVAIQDEHDSGLLASVAANKKSITLRSQGDEYLIESDQLISFSVFQNFLEKMTQDSDCAIDLIAIKIRRVGEIFQKTTAAEFISFLEATAKVAVAEFGPEQAFITHIGNGIFLCASQSGD